MLGIIFILIGGMVCTRIMVSHPSSISFSIIIYHFFVPWSSAQLNYYFLFLILPKDSTCICMISYFDSAMIRSFPYLPLFILMAARISDFVHPASPSSPPPSLHQLSDSSGPRQALEADGVLGGLTHTTLFTFFVFPFQEPPILGLILAFTGSLTH